jgi:hypothetical protein
VVLFVKEEGNSEQAMKRKDNQTETSFSESLFSEKKTFKSSVGKKDKLWLDISQDKVSATFDLTFKRDMKASRKLPLTTVIKHQKRDIGHIEFQAEAFFRTKEELSVLEEQKRGINP